MLVIGRIFSVSFLHLHIVVFVQQRSFPVVSRPAHPVPEVVREYEIPRKRVRERLVEVQHFQQPVPLDGVQVAVGQRPDVRRRLSQSGVLPERIAENVALTCNTGEK